MKQESPPEMAQNGSRRFVLEMIGFTEAEKEMLASTFRLTGRRTFCYAEAAAPDERNDVYLVNADNPAALSQLQTRSPNVHAPAVLIGAGAPESNWPVIDKPIRWMRLFEQLDRVMEAALTERRRRQNICSAKWDGRTYRRSVDRNAAPAPVFMTQDPVDTVLVVDDSATVRAFMRAKLSPFRFDVDYAENGEKAIDMAQAKKNYLHLPRHHDARDRRLPGMQEHQVESRFKRYGSGHVEQQIIGDRQIPRKLGRMRCLPLQAGKRRRPAGNHCALPAERAQSRKRHTCQSVLTAGCDQ